MDGRALSRSIAVGILAAATLLAGSAAGAQESGRNGPVASGAVQVTGTPQASRAHAVPDVAVSPDDDRVLAVAEAEAFTSRCGLHISTDAGMSWTQVPAPEAPAWPNCVNSNLGPITDVEFSPDGTLYYAFSGMDPETYQSRVFLARSDTLGRTWEMAQVPHVEQDLQAGEFASPGLPSIAIDPNDPDRVYVGWMSNNAVWTLSEEVRQGQEYYWDLKLRPRVAVSEDGGQSFGDPVDMAGDLDNGMMTEPDLAVTNDGTLLAFWGQSVRAADDAPEDTPAPPAHLYVGTSTDHGETFSQRALHTRPEKVGGDWLSGVTSAVDRNNGNIYAVWDDNSEGPTRVAFIRSTDGGETFSDPVALNDAEPVREWNFGEFFPSLSVAPNGRVDVAWYDWRNDPTIDPDAEEPSNALQDVYYDYSTDGGKTFGEDRRITDRRIDRRISIAETHGLTGPIGIASTDDAAFIAWEDTRNGGETDQAQDVYFAHARHAPLGELAQEGGSSGDRLVWSGLGAGGALLLGGLTLLAGVRSSRRREP